MLVATTCCLNILIQTGYLMINISIIGLGHIADFQRKALLELNNKYKIISVFDKQKSKTRSFGKKIPYEIEEANTLKKVLDNKNVDCVLISTPPQTHFKITKQCLEAKKDVLLESSCIKVRNKAIETIK